MYSVLWLGSGTEFAVEFFRVIKITASLRENEREDFTRLTSKELIHQLWKLSSWNSVIF